MMESDNLDENTEVQNLKDELYQLQQIFQETADAGQLILWRYYPQNHLIQFNFETARFRLFREVLSIPLNDLKPELLLPLIIENDQSSFLKLFQQIDFGAERVEGDIGFRIPGKNGKNFYYHIIMMRIYDKVGNFLQIYGFAQDVTQRKAIELQYRSAYQQILQTAPSVNGSLQVNITKNWCGNPRGDSMDPCMQNIHTADDLFRSVSDCVADPDIQTHMRENLSRDKLVECFLQGKNEFQVEYPMLVPGRKSRWRNFTITMRQNLITGDIEALACNNDIDPQKQQEHIMERVTEDDFDFIGVLDPKEQIFEFYYRKKDSIYFQMEQRDSYNKDCQWMLDNVVSPSQREMWRKKTQIGHMMRRLEAEGSHAISYEHEIDDDVSYHLIRYSWLDKPGGDILLLHSDVTIVYEQEQRQIRRTQRAFKAAEEAIRAKTDFVTRVSHDIRSPIGLVNSMVGFAFEDIDDREKLTEDLEKIKSAGSLLLGLVNDVLDIARMDNGKLELHLEPCSYDDIVNGLKDIFEPLCKKKKQIFLIKGNAKSTFGLLQLDRVRVRQIILNLVSNAVKYTQEEGIILLHIDVKESGEGKRIMELVVKDTGIGMSKEFQKKMFRPFSQEHENPYRNRGVESTGLGLSIVKNLVDLMHGRMTVNSEVGEGTEICFLVEAETAEKMLSADKGKKELDTKEGLLKGKILLAEDNEINAEIAKRILEKFGLEVDWAENGAVAMKLFQISERGEYSAILMDLQMPILDGYQTTKYIRELRRQDAGTVPIIAMTADAFDEAMENTRKSGMDAHLTKPIEPEKLRQMLQSYLM